jgi:ferredoxin
VEACPTAGALALTEAGPELDPLVCKGCGLCEPACPTGVFALRETESLLSKLGDGPVAVLTCSAARGQDELFKVPCLAALSREMLAGAALGRTLLVIVPAACESCQLGVRTWLKELVEAAGRVLKAFGQTGRVKLVYGEAEAREAVAKANQLHRQGCLNFARLGLMAAVKPAAASSALHDLPTKVPPGRRNFLTAIRRRMTDALPASAPAAWMAFAAVTAGPGCDGCEACTRTCPGGALTLAHVEAADRLRFSADRCTACGLCAEACPQGVLRLADTFSPAAVGKGEVEILATLPVATCQRCGEPFYGESGTCSECRKTDWMTPALIGLR